MKTPRSPDRMGSKRRSSNGQKHREDIRPNYFENRVPSVPRADYSYSPRDRDELPSRPYSPVDDRRLRSPPRGPSYHPDTRVDRYTSTTDRSDRAFPSRDRRNPRDRSSSPGRSRGTRRPTGDNRDRFVERQPTGETYRPVYSIHHSSPVSSPAKPGLIHELRDPSKDPSPRPPTQMNETGLISTTTNFLQDKPIPQNSVAGRESTKNLDSNSEVLISDSPSEILDLIIEDPATHLPAKIPDEPNTDRIMDIESNSTQPPDPPTITSRPAPVSTSSELGVLLFQIIGEATDLAMLKTQKAAAERDYARRDAEFKKSKPNHDKFPATEEVQRRNKDSAKKALASINEKCVKKDSALKEIALQSVARLLPGLVGDSSQDKQKLQSRVNSLEKRCQDLENRLRSQISFVEEQRKASEAFEVKYQTIQNELDTVKGRHSQLDKDLRSTLKQLNDFENEIQPKVNEVVEKNSTNLRELEAHKSDTRRDLSEITDKIPQDLKQRLNDLSTGLDNAKNLIAAKTSEEPVGNTTSSKALAEVADNTKSLSSFGQRLNVLEVLVHGEDNNGGFGDNLKQLIGSHSSHRQMLEKTNKNVDSLLERIKAVEVQQTSLSDLRPKMNDFDTTLKIIETKANDLSSHVEFTKLRKKVAVAESQMNNLKKVLGDREKSPNVLPPAPANTFNGGEQLNGIEKRLSTLEQARSTIMANAPAPDNYESLKREMKEIVEATQSAFDAEMGKLIDELKEKIKGIEKNVEDQKTSYAASSSLPSQVNDLSEKIITITQNEQAHAGVLTQIDSKYNDWAAAQHTIQQQVNNSIDGLTTGIINIEKRLNNINTKDMATFILSQMDSTYPNLRDAQNTLAGHQASLQHADVRFRQLDNFIRDLFGKTKSLEDRIQRDLSDTKTTQDLRREVDELNSHVTTARILAKEAKDAVTVLEKRRTEEAGLQEGKFSVLHNQLGELEDKISISLAKTAKTSSFSPAAENRAPSFANGTSTIRRSKLDSSASRQSSGEPLAKKRRQNGPAKSNGVNGSPRVDRKRKKGHVGERHIEDDDSDDVDFEPNQPTISDDDDDN